LKEETRGRPRISLEKDEIIDALKEVKFMYEAAELLGVSYPTFLREKERHGLGSVFVNHTPRNKKLELIEYESIDEFVDVMEETDEYCIDSVGYDDVFAEINERCIVVPWGDWHIGGAHTRHGQLGRDVKFIKEHSNIYVVMMGDYCDNFDKRGHGGGVYEQVIPIQEQKQRVEYVVRTLKNKILGVVMGCHDKWMFDSEGFDFPQYLAKKSIGSWMGSNGLIHLKVGKQEYDIYASHKCNRWSRDNPCHGVKDESRVKAKFDIGFAAHRHIPGIEYYWTEKDELVVALRCSSYKTTDYFISHKGLFKSPYVLPCVLLDNEEYSINAFWDLREAVKFL